MDRTQGLGGSDIAAILGIDKFRTPLDVYLDKIGEAPEREETEAMKWGKLLEDDVAQEWARLNECKIRRKNKPVRDAAHPWMIGNIDRKVVGVDEGLEVKVSSASGWGDEATDQIPDHYLPQCHFYLAATGWKRWHVAALLWSFGPPKLQSYIVERDDEMAGILIEAGERFMRDHVAKRVPPDPTSSAEANIRWKSANKGSSIVVSDDTFDVAVELEVIKAGQKELKSRRDALELELKSRIRDSEIATTAGYGEVCSWKSQGDTRLDTKTLKAQEPAIYARYVVVSSKRVLRTSKLVKDAAANVGTENRVAEPARGEAELLG